MLIPDLPRTSPERQGIASSALLHFVETLDSQIHELHSFMLLRHGSVVAEGWWSPYRREYRHMVFSLSVTVQPCQAVVSSAHEHDARRE